MLLKIENLGMVDRANIEIGYKAKIPLWMFGFLY